jgi:hypothetical protein
LAARQTVDFSPDSPALSRERRNKTLSGAILNFLTRTFAGMTMMAPVFSCFSAVAGDKSKIRRHTHLHDPGGRTAEL